jgi:hypothetical protein
MSKHTPEPWEINEDQSHDGIFNVCSANGEYICTVWGIHDNGRSNADRIVACVNACAGMDDPQAEIARLKAREAELERLMERIIAMPEDAFDLARHAMTKGCC